ncbi:hypothetical protein [Microcella sp.]|uniref:hypothetical protein n=1 Tax=Microcella sp. TaxID=1913979 RepID=UPI00391D0217
MPLVAFDDISTWRDLIDWAWTGIQDASPWLSPLLWALLLVAVMVVWVKGNGWQKVRAVVSWMQRAVKGVDQILKLADDMDFVKGQLQTNGGSTLKDDVLKVAGEVSELRKTVGGIDKKVTTAARTASAAKSTAAATQKLLIEHITTQST